MKTLQTSSLADLEKRHAAVAKELHAAAPIAMQEYLMLSALIQNRKDSTVRGSEFALVRSPRKVLEMVLVESGQWMSKAQLMDRVIEGGFNVSEAATGRALLNNTINYLVKSGVFIANEDAAEKQIGLPSWKPATRKAK